MGQYMYAGDRLAGNISIAAMGLDVSTNIGC